MPQILKNLMGTGTPAEQAKSIAGRVTTGLTATGSSSQADALALYSEINVVATTAANTGVRLPSGMAGDSMVVQNNGAATLTLYPPTGGKINGGSANAGVSVATLKGAYCHCINGVDWSVIVGA